MESARLYSIYFGKIMGLKLQGRSTFIYVNVSFIHQSDESRARITDNRIKDDGLWINAHPSTVIVLHTVYTR